MIPGRAIRWAALAATVGCGTRDRLTFETPNPGDGAGPTTEIRQPGGPDTVLIAGDLLIIQGRSYDADGVDTVYVAVDGSNQIFAPIPGLGRDTVGFTLQLSTFDLSGLVVSLQAYGVDVLGDQGSVVTRRIRVE